MIDQKEALECRARLGVLAAAILEEAHVLCIDLDAMKTPTWADHLVTLAEDFQTLAIAMEVVARRAG